MSKRRGFTLVELMIALVLTGIVALIAYGSINTAIDTSDRLTAQRQSVEAEALVRTLMSDALRHPADSPDGDPAFELLPVAGRQGRGIQFVSRGFSGSLGVNRLWRVFLRPSRNGLEFEAVSLEGSQASLRAEIPNVASIDVRVLRAADDREWQDHWESTQQFPSAVEITFRDSAGQSGAPLIVQTGFGAN